MICCTITAAKQEEWGKTPGDVLCGLEVLLRQSNIPEYDWPIFWWRLFLWSVVVQTVVMQENNTEISLFKCHQDKCHLVWHLETTELWICCSNSSVLPLPAAEQLSLFPQEKICHCDLQGSSSQTCWDWENTCLYICFISFGHQRFPFASVVKGRNCF